MPTNVRCAGSVPLYLQVFWLPVRQLVLPGYWCVVLVSSQLTATVTVLAPGLAVRTFEGTSHSPYPFEPFSDPERVAAAPLTVTLKLAGTSLFPWSRPPQLTQTEAPKRQSVAATGSVPKYPSVLPQPPVRRTSPIRTWLSGSPSFQRRIWESREKQSAYRSASSCVQLKASRSISLRLAMRTSVPMGRYACPQPP